MTKPQTTRAQDAYAAIRARIVAGDYPPGMKVVVRPVSEALGLSPTPIKSALAALEREGFLIAIPDRGYFVPTIGMSDIQEIYELREAIDGLAARKLASGDQPERFVEQSLAPILERQQGAVAATDIARMRDLDMQFHREIWHASGNSRLAQFTDNLVGQLRIAWGTHIPGGLERAIVEHRAIMNAIAAGDAEAAETASRVHVKQALAAYTSLP